MTAWQKLTALLGWCALVNFILLAVWFLVLSFAGGWYFDVHRAIGIHMPHEALTALHFELMARMKMLVIFFNLVPFLALRALNCTDRKVPKAQNIKPSFSNGDITMAQFTGDFKSFNKYLGPFVRNRVNQITRPHRDGKNGICAHCNNQFKELDSAHVHGRGRQQIMQEVTRDFQNDEGIICGHLDEIMQAIEQKHEPIEEVIKFLCRDCHREYDAQENQQLVQSSRITSPSPANEPARREATGKYVEICSIRFDLPREEGKIFQPDVRNMLNRLFQHNFLPREETERLHQLDYSKKMLGIQFPLFANTGARRYWAKPIGGYYVCSEWWQQWFSHYNQRIYQWLLHLKEINEQTNSDAP